MRQELGITKGQIRTATPLSRRACPPCSCGQVPDGGQARRLNDAIWFLLPLLFCGCAAYQIGNQSLYPPDIHTVSVPVFQSNSFRRNLGERLTEAVVKEIEKRTPYKVVGDPSADSVLTGRILTDRKAVLVPDLTGDARQIETEMRVQVSWVDRKGRLLRDEKAIPLPAEITEVSATADVAPEVGQSIATAQQEAICRLAEQIVGLMEKPW